MASFATQVQIRRGTEAENDAFTGAEGEVTMDLTNKQLRVHDGQTKGGMKIPNINTVFGTSQIQDGAITESKLSADLQTKINEKTSGAGRNIGDIFWTTRTDSALNGAVEANGAQYNFADVNQGQNNVQALLESGALPSVSIAEFDAMVTKQGGCDSFGYGTDTIWSRWSKAAKDFVYTKTTSYEVGDPVYDAPGGNIIGNITETGTGYPMVYTDTNGAASYGTMFVNYVDGPVDSTPYFKVPKKLGRVLVRSQEPTADNNYTWFNLYSDGWVEQGKFSNHMTVDVNNTCMLTIPMKDTNYIVLGVYDTGTATLNSYSLIGVGTKTTQSFQMRNGGGFYSWKVEGYAATSEYTKDKWDYQNIQVERPMVQLFNGATDDAVAKCTEVLSDVAGLKLATDGMIDYVVESQEPTEANGYTWYRKYKSGWVEQGVAQRITGGGNVGVVLPVPMADANYTILISQNNSDGNGTYFQCQYHTQTATGFTVISQYGQTRTSRPFLWYVCGKSAQ